MKLSQRQSVSFNIYSIIIISLLLHFMHAAIKVMRVNRHIVKDALTS